MKNKKSQKDELFSLVESSGLINKDFDYTPKLEFRDLMNYRIEKILMVCSFYDYYTIIEDGHLQEAIFNEYLDINLYYAPHIIRANSGMAALKLLREDTFDLVIVTLRLGDIELHSFCEQVKEAIPDIPLVLLASQSRELYMKLSLGKLNALDKIFIWTGDRKVFLAIIKYFEDIINAKIDCLDFGVTAIILVEDSPAFYSAYLPQIYTEVMNQTKRLIEEGKNSSEKLTRQRARPKILLAETYEEAWDFAQTYQNVLLGIITDMDFKRNGVKTKDAGRELILNVKKQLPDLPILLQSSNPEAEEFAEENKLTFLNKNSRTLLLDLAEFMKNNFGFGDFVFRMLNGTEVGRAKNMLELREHLRYMPEESVLYHSKHNHFSYWLTARTEFELAYKLKPIRNSQFKTGYDLRMYLLNTISKQLTENRRGIISVFTRDAYDDTINFQIIGEGSLGGKARGLAFIDKILKEYIQTKNFDGVNISIPRTLVLGTDIFTQFMEENNLYPIALQNISDDSILHEFLHADLPPTVIGDLRQILKRTKYPIAVRSSSLLEDAVYQPFAGVYATVMIPNSSQDMDVR
ncbi:MAG: PEP/pyruvate-binding domain-containing protein, partial [FCB group bacterium]